MLTGSLRGVRIPCIVCLRVFLLSVCCLFSGPVSQHGCVYQAQRTRLAPQCGHEEEARGKAPPCCRLDEQSGVGAGRGLPALPRARLTGARAAQDHRVEGEVVDRTGYSTHEGMQLLS